MPGALAESVMALGETNSRLYVIEAHATWHMHPTTGWTSKAAAPSNDGALGRQEGATASTSSTFLFAFSTDGKTESSKLEFATDEWTSIRKLPTPRVNAAAARRHSRVVLVGGAPPSSQTTATNTVRDSYLWLLLRQRVF